MNKFLLYFAILATLAVVGLSISLSRESGEKRRFKANQEALLADVEYYKTENGKYAASVQELTLSRDELQRHYDDVCAVADELRIKLKRVESASVTATQTDVVVKTVVKDSIVYVKGETLVLRAFDWRDAWVNVSGVVDRDSVALEVASCDTLTQIVHRIPHKWWIFRWGCKAIEQEIVSSNPHTKITYSNYIKLK